MWPTSKNDGISHRKVVIKSAQINRLRFETYSMKAVISSSMKLAVGIASIILLQACSGHSGAGHWQADVEASTSQYTALELEFDGKGTLHPNKSIAGQEEQSDLWCVWQAKSARALDVQCGDGSVEKTNIKFELTVTGEKQEGAFAYNQADLSKDGRIVATFNRKL